MTTDGDGKDGDQGKLPTPQEQLREIVNKLPEEDRRRFTETLSSYMVSASYEGPLPMAGEFRVYEQVLPGAGQEILDMAKEELAIKRTVLTAGTQNDAKKLGNDKLLIKFIGCTALGIVGVAGIAVWQGHAYLAAGLSLLLSATALLFRYLSKKKDD